MTTPFTPSHNYASVPADAVQTAKSAHLKGALHAYGTGTGTPTVPGPETTPGLTARLTPSTGLPGVLGSRQIGVNPYSTLPTTPHQTGGAPSAPSSVPSSGGLSAEPAPYAARQTTAAPVAGLGTYPSTAGGNLSALGAAITSAGAAPLSTGASPARLPPAASGGPHAAGSTGAHAGLGMGGGSGYTPALAGNAAHSHYLAHPHSQAQAHMPVPLSLPPPPGQALAAMPGTAAGRAGALHPALGQGAGRSSSSGYGSIYGTGAGAGTGGIAGAHGHGSGAPTPTSGGGAKHRYATRDNFTTGAVGPLAGPLTTASGFPNGSGGGVFLTPQQQGQMYAATGGVVGLPYGPGAGVGPGVGVGAGAGTAGGAMIGIAGVGGLAGYDAADLAPLDADVVPAKGYYAVFHWEHFPEAPERVRAKLPRQTKQLPSIPTLFHQLLLILEYAKQAACGEDVLHKLDRKIIKSTGRHAAPGVDPVPGLDAGTEPLFDTSGNWTNLAHPATRLRQLPVYDARGVEYAVVACRREHVTHIFSSPEGAFLDRMGFCPRLLDVYYFTPTEVSCVGGRKVSGGALACVCPGGVTDEPDPEGLELELTGTAMTSGGEATAIATAPAPAAVGAGGAAMVDEEEPDDEGGSGRGGRSDSSGDERSLSGSDDEDEEDEDDDPATTGTGSGSPKLTSPHLSATGSTGSGAAAAGAAKVARKGGRKKRGKGRRRSPAWPSAKPVAVVATAPRASTSAATGAGGALFSFGGLTSSASSMGASAGGVGAGTGSGFHGRGGGSSDPESGGDQSPVVSYLLDKYARGGVLPTLRTPTRTPGAPAAPAGPSKGSPLLEAAAAASRMTATPLRLPGTGAGGNSPGLGTPGAPASSSSSGGSSSGSGGDATATMLWLDMARKLELSQKQIDAAWRRKVAEQQRVGEAWRTQCQILRQRSDEWEALFQRERAQNLALASRLANVERIVTSFAAHGGAPAGTALSSGPALPPLARGPAARGLQVVPPLSAHQRPAVPTEGPIAKAAVAAARAQAQAQAAVARGTGMGLGSSGSTASPATTVASAAAPAVAAAPQASIVGSLLGTLPPASALSARAGSGSDDEEEQLLGHRLEQDLDQGQVKRPRAAESDPASAAVTALPPMKRPEEAADELLRPGREEGKYGELSRSSSNGKTGAQ